MIKFNLVEDKMKNLIVLFAFLSVIIGLYAFTYQNNVFADSLLPCCNNAGCESTEPDPDLGVKCEHTSSWWVSESEPEWYISCKTCVDYTVSGCVTGQGSWYCIYLNGTMYYGNQINCPQR